MESSMSTFFIVVRKVLDLPFRTYFTVSCIKVFNVLPSFVSCPDAPFFCQYVERCKCFWCSFQKLGAPLTVGVIRTLICLAVDYCWKWTDSFLVAVWKNRINFLQTSQSASWIRESSHNAWTAGKIAICGDIPWHRKSENWEMRGLL